jgi:hypothetical protein
MKTMPRKLADERILIPDSLWPNGASLPGVANPYCMFLKSYPIKGQKHPADQRSERFKTGAIGDVT